jgi:hypothetical protein
VLAGSGGGVWTTDDTNISVCIVYLGVLWCMLGLKTAYGPKRNILMIGVGAGLQWLWW